MSAARRSPARVMTHTTDSPNCYNCGAALTGPFCSACGQKAAPLNPTLHDLTHDVVHETLHVDGRIVRSIRQLLLAPGFLSREHFAGRRAAWISPIRLYLVFSVIYFGLAALAGAGGGVNVRVSGSDQDADLKRLGFQSEQELQKTVADAQTKWTPRVMFVLVPLFAWLVHVLCRRAGRNYPQHLYFALHVHAALFAAGAVAAAAKLTGVAPVENTCEVLALVYALWYIVTAIKTAYGFPRRTAVLRGIALAAVYFVIVAVALAAIVVPIILGRR